MLLTHDLEHKVICSLLCITSGISTEINSSVKSPPIALLTGIVVYFNITLEKVCRHMKIIK